MIRFALLFLIIALIAGALGLAGVAWLSSQIAWTLFVIFLILFLNLVGVRGHARRGSSSVSRRWKQIRTWRFARG